MSNTCALFGLGQWDGIGGNKGFKTYKKKKVVGEGGSIMALLCSSGWSRQGERGGWAPSVASPSGSMTLYERQPEK